MDLSPLDQMVTKEEIQQQIRGQEKNNRKKIMRLELHIGSTLETVNAEWKQYIQQLPTTTRRREEEENYAQMVDDERENYYVIRKVLEDKFGQSHVVKKSLYNELHSIKKNDREWKTTVEAVERILRQLEAMGENLEQSSFEIIIENKLPVWILDKVYQQKEEQGPWSVTKLRPFLGKLVQRNEEMTRSQSLNMEKDPEQIKNKPRSYLQHARNETSALAITILSKEKAKENSSSKKNEKTLRLCSFCKQDH
ncbi:unnamed protein product [Onchocerca ochengi]|uniref:Gag_pre-integrs domain-containing protein n=1 Tax=Onchocerca ochengi TaxID=42157 RepID=A0A182EE63_ONCOC|nr:unnamed protein product [Onchocerca ochengi]